MNHVPKDISCAYRRKLVHVSYYYKAGAAAYCIEQAVHQKEVDHGCLVNDYGFFLQRVVPVSAEFHFIFVFGVHVFQKAVDGLGGSS